MKKEWSIINQSYYSQRLLCKDKEGLGFSLVEVILSIAILGLLVTAVAGALLYGQETTVVAGKKFRAVALAEEGLEAVRSIKADDFANLTNGNHGLAIVGSKWVFSGTSDITGNFQRWIEISALDENTKIITSQVNWQQTGQRSGNVSLMTYLANWERALSASEVLLIDTSDATIEGGGDKEVKNITLQNIGGTDLIIDKITVTWDNAQLIEEIKIGNVRIWKHNNEGTPNGRQPSGTELDVDDYTILTNTTDNVDKIKFNGDMSGATLTITLIMGDASFITTSSFSPPDG